MNTPSGLLVELTGILRQTRPARKREESRKRENKATQAERGGTKKTGRATVPGPESAPADARAGKASPAEPGALNL